MTRPKSSRREFVRQAAIGALAGTAAGSLHGLLAADDKRDTASKTKIRIGVRFNDRWLHSENDNDLRFFKQIGVDCVDIRAVFDQEFSEPQHSLAGGPPSAVVQSRPALLVDAVR